MRIDESVARLALSPVHSISDYILPCFTGVKTPILLDFMRKVSKPNSRSSRLWNMSSGFLTLFETMMMNNKMPCYPRNAYCLDRGPPPKDITLQQIFGDKETAIDNLLTESFEGNQDKTVTITEINESTLNIFRCSMLQVWTCDYIEWKNHRKTHHPIWEMIGKRYLWTCF